MFRGAIILALALGIPANTTLSKLGKVRVYVMHEGPPIPVKVVLRHKETREGEWIYIEDLKYLPKRLKTSPRGRSILLSIPPNLTRFAQLCARYTPKPSGASREVLLSVESCANLPRQTSELSQVPTTLKVVV